LNKTDLAFAASAAEVVRGSSARFRARDGKISRFAV